MTRAGPDRRDAARHRLAIEMGAQRVLLVPGDCPALDPAELEQLLDRPASAPSVVIVPDRHGSGTNALAADAARRHRAGVRPRQPHAARACGGGGTGAVQRRARRDARARRRHRRRPRALRAALAARRGGAAHTRGMLSRLAPHPRGDRRRSAARPPRGPPRRRSRAAARRRGRRRSRLGDGDVLVVAHKVVSKARAASSRSATSSRASGRARWRPSTARTRAWSSSSSTSARRSCARARAC